MVMISLGCSCVRRTRWRSPEVSSSWCHLGAKCCQKSSTEQKSSSILIAEPPGDRYGLTLFSILPGLVPVSRTHVLLSKGISPHDTLARLGYRLCLISRL